MDTPALPPGFRKLDEASHERDRDHSIVGVVTDYMSPEKSRGTDWQLTCNIQSNEIGSFGSGYRVKFFAAEGKLPPLTGVNDVIFIRNIKVKEWSGATIFLSNYNTHSVVIPASSMPEKFEDVKNLEFRQCPAARARKFIPDLAMMRYAWAQWDYWKVFKPDEPASTVPSTENGYKGKQGFKLLENVSPGGFYDLVGQVVKLYDRDGYGAVTLYLTDYTSNILFYNFRPFGEAEARDGDDFGYTTRKESSWKGPSGQFTLAVDLWDAHAKWCREHVKENDYVRLTNVQIGFSKDGGNKVEGKMRGDRKWPDRVNISRASHSELSPDDDVKELLIRKRDFIKQFGNWEKDEDSRGRKRKHLNETFEGATKKSRYAPDPSKEVGDGEDEDAHQPSMSPTPAKEENLSRNQRRRRRDKSKREAEAAAKAAAEKENIPNHDQISKPEPKVDIIEPDDEDIPLPRKVIRTEFNTLNPSIANTHRSEPLLTLRQIAAFSHDHPSSTPLHNKIVHDYQTRTYATQARVVDFHPADLRDFAIRQKVSEFDILEADDEVDEDPTDDIQSQISDESSWSDYSSDGELPTSSGLPADTPSSSLASQAQQPSSPKPYRWIWRFALLLEEPSPPQDDSSPVRLVVHVSDEDATYLLKGLEACNLHKRKNESTLELLREKLFHLWGNLQEKKEEAALKGVTGEHVLAESSGNIAARAAGQMGQSTLDRRRPWRTGATNRPFRCCLRESGRKVRMVDLVRMPKGRKEELVYKWEREWRMFDTTIKS